MLLTTRENEMGIMDELDMGSKKGFCALFRIISDGLKLVDCHIDLLSALFKVVENALEGMFCMRLFNANRYIGRTRNRVKTDGWSPRAEEVEDLFQGVALVEKPS